MVPGITRLEVVVLERRTDCGPKRQVAESDDVTHKPPLVSWLHSVSYHCSQSTIGSSPSKGPGFNAVSRARSVLRQEIRTSSSNF